MKLWIAAFCIALLAHSFAATSPTQETEETDKDGGIHVGNGGKVITCPDETDNYKLSLLDYFEVGSKELELGLSTDPIQMAKFAISKIRELDPVRHLRILGFIDTFYDDTRFVENHRIGDVSDFGLALIPHNCKLSQAAIQFPHYSGEMDRKYIYVIDKLIWKKLSADHQAGLILHEVIYRDFIQESKHEISYYVRKAVGALSTSSTGLESLKNYITFLKNLQVKTYNYKGYTIDISFPVTFFKDEDAIAEAHLVPGQEFTFFNNRVRSFSTMPHQFYSNGQLKYISITPEYGNQPKDLTIQFSKGSYTMIASVNWVNSDENGSVESFKLNSDIFSKREFNQNDLTMILLPNQTIKINKKMQRPDEIIILRNGPMNFSHTSTLVITKNGYQNKPFEED